jgi:hypothetical protein
MSTQDSENSVAFRCSKVLDWVTSQHDGNCVIVGGAVRDILLGNYPKDWDVYYLGCITEELRMRWSGQTQDMRRPFRRHKKLSAELNSPFGDVQIFASEKTSAQEILEDCDWNISAFAFDGELLGKEHIDEIGKGKTLRLLKVTNPITTLSRGFDFSKRFEMLFDTKDLVALCGAVASGEFICRKPRVRARRRFR